MLRNFADHDYSTDEGTDSEDKQIEDGGGQAAVGSQGEQQGGRAQAAVGSQGEQQGGGAQAAVGIQWIESKRGRAILAYGSFTYYHDYDAEEKIDGAPTSVSVYHCVEYRSHCKAKVWIRDGKYHKRSAACHNHLGDPIDVGSRLVRHKGKEILRSNPLLREGQLQRPIGQVINKALEKQDEEVVADVDRENFRRELSRERRRVYKLPKGRTDPMHLGIPAEWRVFDDGEPFVLFDNGRCTSRVNTNAAEHVHDNDKCKERVIIVSSRHMMEIFVKNSNQRPGGAQAAVGSQGNRRGGGAQAAQGFQGRWAGDGTFYSKPGKQWSQLYVLHVEVEQRFVPRIAVLLGRATTATYLIMLQAIDEWVKLNIGVDWEPGVFFSDFELAIRNAIQRYFDGRVTHKCCYFHFYKAILEHISEAGLKAKFESDPSFYMFVRSFPALALINPEHIDVAFVDIKERAKLFTGAGYEGMEKFIKYFESTWIRKVNAQGIITASLIPRKFWNHHQAALNDEAKTTCNLEEFHKDVNFAIDKYPQKSLWYLLFFLKDQFGNISPNRVIQLESPSQNKRLPKQKEQRANKLRKALIDFDPLDVKKSLVRIARASRYDDKKDPVPKRVGTKRRQVDDEDEEEDDGGGDDEPVNLATAQAMRL